jgi:hypothetical protein
MRERYHRLRPGAGEGVGWRGAACRGVLGARVVAVLLWDKTKQECQEVRHFVAKWIEERRRTRAHGR